MFCFEAILYLFDDILYVFRKVSDVSFGRHILVFKPFVDVFDGPLWFHSCDDFVGASSVSVGPWCRSHDPLGKFHPSNPLTWMLSGVGRENVIDNLVSSFDVALTLRVVRGAKSVFDVEGSVDRFNHVRSEGFASVASQNRWKSSHVEKDVFDKEFRPLVG